MAQAHAIPILRVAGGAALVDLLTCRHVGRSGRVARGRIHDEQAGETYEQPRHRPSHDTKACGTGLSPST
jgi:hypothetical protein